MSSKKPPGPPGGNGGDDKKANKNPPPKQDDDDAANGGSAGGAPEGGAKPGSAGATTRDAALRLLAMCQKGEWPPVDQALKSLEKAVATAKAEAKARAEAEAPEGEVVHLPLASVADPVSTDCTKHGEILALNLKCLVHIHFIVSILFFTAVPI